MYKYVGIHHSHISFDLLGRSNELLKIEKVFTFFDAQ